LQGVTYCLNDASPDTPTQTAARCPRGGELDDTVYFVPVRGGLADAEEGKR
jgi:hypothetical protein